MTAPGRSHQEQQRYAMRMAGTLLPVLPVVGLFLLQGKVAAGLTAGEVKG